MKVLVVVKAAPNPSAAYGETVCVAGLRLDLHKPGWVRLYPINFRELEQPDRFTKYDVLTLEARPNHKDRRAESWRPVLTTVEKYRHLSNWQQRRRFIADHLDTSMCGLLHGVRSHPPARSLGALRPSTVTGIDLERHPGWSADQQEKINAYVQQLDVFAAEPRRALQAPRFQGWYRYRCSALRCRGHRQGILDWEFVAHQRKLDGYSDEEAEHELRRRWLGQTCASDRDVVFFVGNQAKHENVFSVLGVFYPPR